MTFTFSPPGCEAQNHCAPLVLLLGSVEDVDHRGLTHPDPAQVSVWQVQGQGPRH